MLSVEEVEKIKQKYPSGTRIKLEYMNDDYGVPSGTYGTVKYVDDALQIHVAWDNGGSIALLPEEGDIFKIISIMI